MDESFRDKILGSELSIRIERFLEQSDDHCDDTKDIGRQLYLKEYLADIHFKIGANGDRLPAHRWVLYVNKCAQIFDNQNEVSIDDIDCHSFRLFLGYFYNNEIKLTEEVVPHIMRLCDLFECNVLRKICCKFKYECIQNDLEQLSTYMNINSMSITNTANVSNNERKRSFVNSFEPVVDTDMNDLNKSNKKSRVNEATTDPIGVNTHCDSDSVRDLNQSNAHMNISFTSISESNVDINGENCGDISIDYRLIKQHRCHNKNETNVSVWRSIFVPILENDRKSIVTCGGYSSARIEFLSNDKTEVIKVINKIETETLFSVACTVLSSDDNTSLISGKHVVIALGGEKCIYCVHNHKIYKRIPAHNGSVYSLVFHTRNPLWLFSASCDKTIKLWDIGVISSQKAKIVAKDGKLLWSFNAEFSLLSLSYSLQYDTLIACGESSDVMFFKNFSNFQPLQAKTRIGDKFTTISSVIFAHNSKYIAIRPSKSGKILVTHFSPIIEIIEARHQNKTINSAKPLEIDFARMASLKYSTQIDNDKPFIYLCERSGIVACGDDSGRVFLYDLRPIKCGDAVEPIKILELPRDDQSGDKSPPIVLSVDISHDSKHIAASTNNNLVCIWKLNEKD